MYILWRAIDCQKMCMNRKSREKTGTIDPTIRQTLTWRRKQLGTDRSEGIQQIPHDRKLYIMKCKTNKQSQRAHLKIEGH